MSRGKSGLKLFVWEGDGVLQDYTRGMVVALGTDLQQALDAVEGACSYAMNSFPTNHPTWVIDLASAEGVETRAWVCWGGG